MAVSEYINNPCKYNIDKLAKVVYLIDENASKNIHIDDGEAYIADIDQEPMALSVYNIALSDTDELDERYKFTHRLTFSMNGYVNYRDFQGRYYVIVKTVDEEYWLVNPLFPCKVTYTYTLGANESHTDFTLSTISNHPTLRIHNLAHSTPYECGYVRCGFDSLKLNESINSLKRGNHVLYTNDGFKDIVFKKNTGVFTEQFDGNNIQHNLKFDIKFDDYKSSWHYNLLEFVENTYSAIIKTTCNKYILCGFGFGLQPSFNVDANDNAESDKISIDLIDMHDNGDFIGYVDDVTIEKDGTTNWAYTNKYNGYECVGNNLARYLLMEEVDALMNPTGNYKVLVGYEDQFTFLNIVGTFTETVTFNSYDCADSCRLQSSFPLEFVFNNVSCREYSLISDSDWSITSSVNYITVSPSNGLAGQSYTVSVCNTILPQETEASSTLSINYCNRVKTYNVKVKRSDSCLPAGAVFDISANGQYVTIPTACCVTDAKDFGGTITNISIQNNYIRVYVPQNNSGNPRQFIISITYCDGREGEAIINQGTGFERWVKESTACTGNQKCDVERKYTGTTVSDINTRTEETRMANCITSSECGGSTTRWIDSSETTCSGGKKYIVQIEQVSTDGGSSWSNTGNKRLGSETPDPSGECAGVEELEDWRENGYICNDTTKYVRLQLYVSTDGQTWVATNTYKRGDRILETNSVDCGYVTPSTGWTCDKWETADGYICEGTTKYAREQWYVRNCSDCNNCGTEWIATGVYRRTNTVLETNSVDCGYIKGSDEWTCEKWDVADGYICEETTKYAREQRYVRDCENCNSCTAEWIPTGVYRRTNTVLETNSADCGYVKPSTAWTCSKWEVVQNDYICEDGTKYTKERRYVRECEDCSDCSAPWIPTDVYRRGSTVLEENSTDCGYSPTVTGNCTEYRDEGGTICDGFDKYKYLRKYVRECENCNDCSASWVATNIYKRGALVQANSVDCGYIPSDTYERWVEDGYMCDGYSKYKRLRKEISEDNVQWYRTSIYKRGTLIQANSIDCGYIPTDTYTEWRVEGTMCNGYNLYYMERKYISDDGNNWYQTNIYKQGSLIEEKSLDCGYTPPHPSWFWEDWRVVETDYICEDGNKYEKLRRWVSNDQVSSKDQVTNWTPTDVYKRGELLEENSGDCGYDPSITGNCSEYRDNGDTICDGFDKYKYLRKYVRECEDCNNCTTEWQETQIFKRGDKIQEHSLDCGYIPSDNYYEWREDGWDCNGYDKYQKYRKYISEDGNNWYATNIYKLGDSPIEVNSADCGYVPRIHYEYQWVESDVTKCVGTTKYYQYKKQRRIEGSQDPWEDVIPTVYSVDADGTMQPRVAEQDSLDCGYVPPVQPRYRWVTLDINKYWICGDCDDTPDELQKIEYRENDEEADIRFKNCDGNSTLTSTDYGNRDIVYAKIGSCVTVIGENAFQNKINLKQVMIPSTVDTIEDNAFYGCTGLIDFSLPMSVVSIGDFAFYNDIQLNRIMLPNNLTTLGSYAFSGCKNFPSINIPQYITIIPTGCFYDCDGMTDIYLPENVRLIQSKAFGECSGLVNFTCYATEPPAIYSDTFSGMNEDLKIYVPAASVNAYKLAWSAYADNIVAIGE